MPLWIADEVAVNPISTGRKQSRFISPQFQHAYEEVCKSRSIVAPKLEEPPESKTLIVSSQLYQFCEQEPDEAVIDTGCQRSAIGSNTLKRIASRLPSHLNVKYRDQKFRFRGVGGETITKTSSSNPSVFWS